MENEQSIPCNGGQETAVSIMQALHIMLFETAKGIETAFKRIRMPPL